MAPDRGGSIRRRGGAGVRRLHPRAALVPVRLRGASWPGCGATPRSGGRHPLRKWERKYALTTEYAIKAIYGWLIKIGTQASYDAPLPVTAVLIDRLPEGVQFALPELKLLKALPDGTALVTVPRSHAFMRYAGGLASRGATFIEIAGNRSTILVSAIAPDGWSIPGDAKLLFAQPILTVPGRQRVALEVPVASLAALLNRLRDEGIAPEHVFDY